MHINSPWPIPVLTFMFNCCTKLLYKKTRIISSATLGVQLNKKLLLITYVSLKQLLKSDSSQTVKYTGKPVLRVKTCVK